MKVSILVKEFPPDVIGGTETQTLRMARELESRTNHDVTVYTKAYNGKSNLETSFELVRVPNWRVSEFMSTLTFVLLAFVYLLRDRNQIDILQCMMIYPNGFVGYIFSKFTGTPYFAWIRGGDYYFMKENAVKRRMIHHVFQDTLVLVQTEAVRDDVLSEFPDASLKVFGNGVNIPSSSSRAGGDEIVFVGRLKRQKGVHILLRAMEEMDRHLLIVGDGPERPRLEGLAEELNVKSEFVGNVNPEEVDQYLRRGCLFVLPSVEGEGLPNAILEAMALGLPVIGTNTGGVRDVIEDGKTGYVVEPGDVHALRERIDRIASNPSIKEEMGEKARAYVVNNHSWNEITSRLSKLYQARSN